MRNEHNKEWRVRVMHAFVEANSTRTIAEFLVNQSDAIEGLNENNRALADAYGCLLDEFGDIDLAVLEEVHEKMRQRAKPTPPPAPPKK